MAAYNVMQQSIKEEKDKGGRNKKVHCTNSKKWKVDSVYVADASTEFGTSTKL